MAYFQESRRTSAAVLRAVIFAVAASATMYSVAGAATFYVAPSGDDRNPGTAVAPFRTLQAARDAIRRTSGRTEEGNGPAPGWDGATVVVSSGTYVLEEPLLFDRRDSGTEQNPIAYVGPADGSAIITGAVPLPEDGWRPVTDPAIRSRLQVPVRDRARQFNLRTVGMKNAGNFGASGARMDLLAAGRLMNLARWPNTGWGRVQSVLGDGTRGEFTVGDDRIKLWAKADAIWLHGYWADTTDSWSAVANIDGANRKVTLAAPWNDSGYRADRWFEAYNVLEELDLPGEWWFDVEQMQVVAIPLTGSLIGNASLTSLQNTVVGDGTDWVEFSNVIIEGSRADAFVWTNATGLTLKSCQIRNCGGWGVRILGGSNALVDGVTVSDTGEGGIDVSGGDRTALTSSGHTIENCEIVRFGRTVRAFRPGVALNGVGITVRNCTISDGPHVGLMFAGNDHLIETSRFRRLALETDRGAGIQAGRDWTFRGNVIRGNDFEDINAVGLPATVEAAAGVRLDECLSGTTVENNTFTRCGYGILIDGGRDNIVRENRFSACVTPVYLGSRQSSASLSAVLNAKLQAVPYQSATWSSWYPELAGILGDNPMAPQNNSICDNQALDLEWLVDASLEARPHVPTDDTNRTSAGPLVPLLELLAYTRTPPADDPPSGLVLYVSPAGNDLNPGTEAAPLKTLEAARDQIRTATGRTTTAKAPPAAWTGATVVLAGGTHSRTAPFVLDGRDSGTEQYPITYRGAVAATVTIDAAYRVRPNDWVRVTSADTFAWSRLPGATRERTWKLDLRALGVDLGSLAHGQERVELSANGALQKLARYPRYRTDGSPADYLQINEVVDSTLGSFKDSDSHLGSYSLSGQSPYMWCFSRNDYLGQWQKIAAFSGSNPTTVTLSGFSGGSNIKPMSLVDDGKGRYAIYNCLEDLADPGCYALIVNTSTIYFQPVDGAAPAEATLTRSGNLLELDGAHWIGFRDVTLRGVRGHAVQLLACEGFSLGRCTIEDVGRWGVVTGGRIYRNSGDAKIPARATVADGVSKLEVTDSIVRRTGEGALFVIGGDPALLRSSVTLIDRNTFSDTCRLNRSLSGINIFGVGFEVTRNTFSDMPGGGITYKAINARFAENRFSRLVTECGDYGAIYTGATFLGSRGSVIENNSFSDIGAWNASVPPKSTSAWAVYLDDLVSGVTVRNNIMVRCGSGIQVTGHDHFIVGNLFTDCHNIPNRKLETLYVGSRHAHSGKIQGCDIDMLDINGSGVRVDEAPWTTFWPDGATFLPGGANYGKRGHPTGNIVLDNRSTTAGTQYGPPSYPYYVLIGFGSETKTYFDMTQRNFDVSGVLRPVSEISR